jgi:hypothetical protein
MDMPRSESEVRQAPAMPPPNVIRRKFIVATTAIGSVICLLFFFNLLYLYGSVYHQEYRYQAFDCLLVDYDGGVVGKSLQAAYEQLQGPSFPTFIVQNTTVYPSPADINQAILNREYWCAIYANPDASKNLAAALAGGTAATSYDAANALTYVWNEDRFPATADSVIQPNLVELVAVTQAVYQSINGSEDLKNLPKGNAAAAKVLFNPIMATNVNLQGMPQASKVFYNTVSMAMPILQQFFFVLAFNGIAAKFRIHEMFPSVVSGILRFIIAGVYTIFSALIMTGYIWSFRETWAVTSNTFGLTFLALWWLMQIWFLLIDFFLVFLPTPAMPFVIVTIIFLNITATNAPFELNPGFFRIGYAFPAYEIYSVLIDIWSGSTAALNIALPVLFSWWLLGWVLAFVAHRRRYALVRKGKSTPVKEDPLASAMTPAGDLEKAEPMTAVTEHQGLSQVSHGGSTLDVNGDVAADADEKDAAVEEQPKTSSSYAGDADVRAESAKDLEQRDTSAGGINNGDGKVIVSGSSASH